MQQVLDLYCNGGKNTKDIDIDRGVDTCCTPWRNALTDEAIEFMKRYSHWCDHASEKLTKQL